MRHESIAVHQSKEETIIFTTIEAFLTEWGNEAAATERLLAVLTDESLQQRITPRNRSLGQLASHIVTSPHEMMARTGLVFECPLDYDEVPQTASVLAQAYRAVETGLATAIRTQWTDESLTRTSDMYGEMWPNGMTLRVVINHEIHHRGQMTVLIRQAGLPVPGIFGPALEDWAKMGMAPPAV